MNKFYWITVSLILTLCIICALASFTSIVDFFFMVAWCSWAPVSLAIFHQLYGERDSLPRFVATGAFLPVSLFTIFYMGILMQPVINSGSIGPAGMIIIFFPVGFFGLGIAGGAFGAFIHAISR